MKKLTVLLLVMVIAVLSFAADRDWLVDKYSKGGKRGGTLFLSITSAPKTFNTCQTNDSVSTLLIGYFQESLLTQDTKAALNQPLLAKEFSKKVVGEGVEYYFTIRHGVEWSDGKPFTLDDVIFTFEELVLNGEMRGNGNDGYKDDKENLPKIVKVDEDTVKVVYTSKFRRGFEMWGSTAIMPKHIFGKYAKKPDEFKKMWTTEQVDKLVGTGPFLIKEYKQGVRIVLERNPDYYIKSVEGVQLPYLDKVIYTLVSDNNTQRLKFEAGEIDMLAPTPTDFPSLKAMSAAKNWKTIVGGATQGSEFIALNWEAADKNLRNLFRDINFRKAVACSLNRNAIIDNLYNGLGMPIYTEVSKSSPFYNEKVDKYGEREYAFSLAKSRDYLSKVKGGKIANNVFTYNGKPVEITMSVGTGSAIREEIANVFADSMKKFGIKVNLRPLAWATYVQKLTQGDYDATVVGFTGSTDPASGWNVWRTDGALHFWNFNPEVQPFIKGRDYQIPEFEKRIHEIFVTQIGVVDDKKLSDMFDEYQMIVAQNLPVIHTITQKYLIVHKASLHLSHPNPTPYTTAIWNIWGLWKE